MAQTFTEIRRVLATVLTVIGSNLSCPSRDAPGRQEVLAQVRTAVESRAVPRTGSDVEGYFACEPYQRVAGFEFVGASSVGLDTAEAIVQIAYEYLVPSMRITDDLDAGIGPPAYYTYSSAHLASREWFSGRYFPAGTRYVVPGRFVFVRTDTGWVLQ
jgi:hypothetical protein